MLIGVKVLGCLLAVLSAALATNVLKQNVSRKLVQRSDYDNECVLQIGNFHREIQLKKKKIAELTSILKAKEESPIGSAVIGTENLNYSLQLCQSKLVVSNDLFNKQQQLIGKEDAKILVQETKLNNNVENFKRQKQKLLDNISLCEKNVKDTIDNITITTSDYKLVKRDFKELNDTLTECKSNLFQGVDKYTSLNQDLLNKVYELLIRKFWLSDSATLTDICEFDGAQPGWIVIQRRSFLSNKVDFNKKWLDYQMGFGKVEAEYWLGLDNIYNLTKLDRYELAIQFLDDNNLTYIGNYNQFKIAGEEDNYKLLSLGNYSGTIGDGMQDYIGRPFTTFDRDNNRQENCAGKYNVGWWYADCNRGNLNKDISSCDFANPSYKALPDCSFWPFTDSPGFVPKRMQMMIRRYQL